MKKKSSYLRHKEHAQDGRKH